MYLFIFLMRRDSVLFDSILNLFEAGIVDGNVQAQSTKKIFDEK